MPQSARPSACCAHTLAYIRKNGDFGVFGRRRSVALLATAAAVAGLAVVALDVGSPAQAADAPTGTTVRTSVQDTGAQAARGGGDSQLSGNGRFDVFESSSALAPGWPDIGTCGCGDNPAPNNTIYVRDLVANRTDIVSFGQARSGPSRATPRSAALDSAAAPADNSSYFPSISADGRYVAFFTDATNIAAATDSQIVVCDRGAPNGDGTFDRAPTPGSPVDSGRCVEVGTTQTRTDVGYPHLSADASRIVWASQPAESAVSAAFTIALRYDATGRPVAPDLQSAQQLPEPADGFPSTGRTSYIEPQISADGNWVVAEATDKNTLTDGIIEADLGANPAVVRRVDYTGTQPNSEGFPLPTWVGNDDIPVDHPSVSGDGSTIAFDANYSPTFDGYPDVYATTVDTADFADARFSPARPAFVDSGAYAGTTPQPGDGAFPTVSADGTYLAFVTDRAGMYVGDPGTLSDTSCLGEPYVDFAALEPPPGTQTKNRTACQVVQRDLREDEQRQAGSVPLRPASLASPGTKSDCGPTENAACAGTGDSANPVSLSVDGSRVGFDSKAGDLVTGDTNAGNAGSNGGSDAFVRNGTVVTAAIPPFGEVVLGQGPVGDLVVTSSGFGSFRPGDITITGPDASAFQVVGSTCAAPAPSLRTGDTCTVDIRFQPTRAGTDYTATVTVHAADNTTVVATAPLTGTGTRTAPTTLPPSNTVRTSRTSTGGQAPTGGDQSMISGNGRWDVFVSRDDLAGHRNAGIANVFVRDLADPVHTVQISLGNKAVGDDPSRPTSPDGTAPDGPSAHPSISADGRFVAFTTLARNIVAEPALDSDTEQIVVVCDRDPSGAKDAHGDLSLDRATTAGVPDYRCYAVFSPLFARNTTSAADGTQPRLSADGTHITWPESDFVNYYTTAANAWVATVSSPQGALHAPSSVVQVQVDASSPGLAGFATHSSEGYAQQPDLSSPSLTDDGKLVVFAAHASSLSYPNRPFAIVENDLSSTPQASVRLDVEPDGSGYLGDVTSLQNEDNVVNIGVGEPATSGTGAEVAFTYGTNTGTADTAVYVATLGATKVTSAVESLDNAANASQGFQPTLSGDGRYLAFVTDGLNMHDGADGPIGSCRSSAGNRGQCEVVAKDLVSATDTHNHLVSYDALPGNCSDPTAGCAADGPSTNPSMDAIGSEIGFDSQADDLVPSFDSGDHDTNRTDGSDFSASDAFVHTWRPTLSTSPVDFGRVGVGLHKDATVTLTETGFGPLAPGATPITGADAADFTRAATTCAAAVLHADGSAADTCTLTLRFTPKAKGSRSANLAVDTRANGYPRLDPLLVRTLTGVGIKIALVPRLVATPSPVDFGTPLPQDPTTRTVTITNGGDSILIVSGGTVVDGTVPGSSHDYTVDVSGCAAGVPPGGTCTITVTFTGSTVGPRDVVLVVTSNSGTATSIPMHAVIAPPAVTTNPAVTPTGRVIGVSGTGFGPNQSVDLTFTGMSAHVPATTDGTGAFTVPGFVLLPNGTLGPHTLLARTSPSISASVQVLVVLGSVQGPILVTRR